MPAEYLAMLRATDPASVVEHGTWARDIDPGRPWGSGPVTLVGDAAHPIRPVTGAVDAPGTAPGRSYQIHNQP
jgi:hypothetical protein